MITIKLKDNSRLFLEEGAFKGDIARAQQLIQAFCNEPNHRVFVTGYGLAHSVVHINDDEFGFGKPGVLVSSMLKWCGINSTNAEQYDEMTELETQSNNNTEKTSASLKGIKALGMFAKKDSKHSEASLKSRSLTNLRDGKLVR